MSHSARVAVRSDAAPVIPTKNQYTWSESANTMAGDQGKGLIVTLLR